MQEPELAPGGMLSPDPEASKPLDRQEEMEEAAWKPGNYQGIEDDNSDYQQVRDPLDTDQESLEYLVDMLEEDEHRGLEERFESVYGRNFGRVKHPNY